MSHYVAYHNPQAMGYTAAEVIGFGVLTNKSPASDLQGSTIWLVTGEGAPRKYFLVERFTADLIESAEDEGFATRISSEAGERFSPMIRLDEKHWFKDFLRSNANFSLGLRRITDQRFIHGLEEAPSDRADIAPPSLAPLVEGAAISVTITSYERNPAARQLCLQHYGTSCFACGFSFGERYGDSIKGCIHVHHIESIASRQGEHIVDPIRDLRPVCPNCHAVIHSTNPSLSIEDLQRLLRHV
jgi:hypothetical protein